MKILHSIRSFTTKNIINKNLEDIIQNYKSVRSPSDRLALLISSSLGALRDPMRADLVAACGDLSSQAALKSIRYKMMQSETGRQILEDKPRVTSKTWPVEEMVELAPNTFGHHYAKWMQRRGFVSDERPVAKYVQDLELAYIMQRYREIHDIFHVLLGYNVTVSEELAVKWYEMSCLGLPSASLASFVGPLNLLREG